MPVYIRYRSWYVFFWTNEGNEPIHFHIAEGRPSQNATKVWVLNNGSFRLQHNNSKVPANILSRVFALMQSSLDEYKDLWLQYQKTIRYIDD